MHTKQKHFLRSLSNYNFIKNNVQKIDTGKKIFRCLWCEYKTLKKTKLKHHVLIHIEKKPYSNEKKLKWHKKIFKRKQPVKCKFCEYKTAHKRHLEDHERTHTGEKPFKCTVCDYKASRRHHIKRHAVVHTGEKPFHCTRCEYKTGYQNSLKIHEEAHVKQNRFICRVCHFKTASSSGLTCHTNKYHSVNRPISKKKVLSCHFCNYNSLKKSHVKRHEKKHFTSNDLLEIFIPLPLEFESQLWLNQSKKIFFSLSELKSTSSVNLIHNKKTDHEANVSFSCKLCDYVTVKSIELRKHEESHKGEVSFISNKIFTCHLCDYNAFDKDNIEKHENSHFTNNGNFEIVIKLDLESKSHLWMSNILPLC